MYEKRDGENEYIGNLLKNYIDKTVDLYDNIKDKPVCPAVNREALSELNKADVPELGRPLEEVYNEMINDVYSSVILAQHPRSFSCVPSTVSMLSFMGDVMTSAYNPHASCKINAPASDLIEKKLIKFMCKKAGYPEGSGGLFVSGGSIANLTALTAARDAKLLPEERCKAVVYVSDQTHYSVAKGLHIIGFNKEQIKLIPTDEEFRMNVAALKSEIENDVAAGKKPFAIVASAGTTNTGSIDPLKEISELCREYDMWMHVDGAYGASVLLSEKNRERLNGIELSDSLSWDAHKWLFQTYGCSVVLVKNKADLIHSFAAHPEYLKDAETSENNIEFWDLGPELTRPARALKLWITLNAMGTEAVAKAIDHGCEIAEYAAGLVRIDRDWEIVSDTGLGIINFRYVAENKTERELNEINRIIAKEITESGFAEIFTTELRGKKVLRMCTIHPETTEKDISDTIEKMKKIGERLCRKNDLSELKTAI